MFVHPFLMIQILNPCLAEFLLVVYYYCIGLKNQTSFVIQTEFEESANLPSPKTFYNKSIPENEMQQVPRSDTKDKHLPGMLTYKVGHLCRLRFSWLHE